MGVGGQHHAPAALPPGKTRCPFTGGWIGTRAGLDGYGKSSPPPGFDPRTVQNVASRYTACVIPAHISSSSSSNSISSSSSCTEWHHGEFLFECRTCSDKTCARHLEIHCCKGLRFTLEQSKLKPTRSGIILSRVVVNNIVPKLASL